MIKYLDKAFKAESTAISPLKLIFLKITFLKKSILE